MSDLEQRFVCAFCARPVQDRVFRTCGFLQRVRPASLGARDFKPADHNATRRATRPYDRYPARNSGACDAGNFPAAAIAANRPANTAHPGSSVSFSWRQLIRFRRRPAGLVRAGGAAELDRLSRIAGFRVMAALGPNSDIALTPANAQMRSAVRPVSFS